MRLAIVGSTNISDNQADAVTELCLAFIDHWRPTELISGGAKGVDSLAEAAARLRGVEPVIFYPKNQRWEPEGFKDRNMLIARRCETLICIRSQQSQTYGSGWTADCAERLEKVVLRYWI